MQSHSSNYRCAYSLWSPKVILRCKTERSLIAISISLIQLFIEQLFRASLSSRHWRYSSEQIIPQTLPAAYSLRRKIVNNADIWGKKVPGRENSKCKAFRQECWPGVFQKHQGVQGGCSGVNKRQEEGVRGKWGLDCLGP